MLEAEILRLNHLRDRASEKGHKKEYPLLFQIVSFYLIFEFSPANLNSWCLKTNAFSVFFFFFLTLVYMEIHLSKNIPIKVTYQK